MSILTNEAGQTFKLGRNRPTMPMRLRLQDYLAKVALPAPPATCSYSASAASSLANIYGNDTLGDCVIAGMGHIIGVLSANSGPEFIFSQQQIISLYSAIGGYVPGNPSTDNGCDEVTALNHLRNKGAPIGHHKIAASIGVNPANPVEYRTALWLFENLMFGLELPDAWITPFPSKSGFVWDVAGKSDQNNGHCVIGCGYDSTGVTIATWGMLGTMTDAAIADYLTWQNGGQLFCVLSTELINSAIKKSPAGLNWAQLVTDFASL